MRLAAAPLLALAFALSACLLVIRRNVLMFFPPFPIAKPMSPCFATNMILPSFSSMTQSCVVAPVMFSNSAMPSIPLMRRSVITSCGVDADSRANARSPLSALSTA